MKLFSLLISSIVLFCSSPSYAIDSYPVIRLKVGKFVTNVIAGDILDNEPLNSTLTFQPTILWDYSTFRSRIGYHFTGDFSSDYGLFPISGIGFSGYFYPFGISSTIQTTITNVEFQRYKVSPYIFGSITPVNFNLNRTEDNIRFSAFLVEINLGAGLDYPFKPNTLVTLDLNYRFAASPTGENSNENLSYSAIGITVGFMTSYY